ncbi:TetR/AcrR family transcriptional regulator [Rhizobium sp. CG5]|uniref:TetR/AcrR family transcriptional regulator n=1 Tax=Rhizobium sp. CG5 TaxID=2726076 RepID=UPI002033B31E|nr:TetR/AcrR family transcriptional regulator [Rhizobium sp. CG5]MCM2475923.1 TetR/AcrR family transcriptional regulator [Rhizobium sp. CG5]
MTEKSRRRRDPQERRADILAAALSLFAERGFAATRIEDVAAKAGIAKGTVYLHFPDKEALFTSLASTMASPILEQMEMLAANDAISSRAMVAGLYELVQTEILGTVRGQMLRLLLAEGQFFPVVTEFYHRNVMTVGLRILRTVLERAAKRGELHSAKIAAFPQMAFAPVLLSIVWQTLFEPYEHLDTRGLFEAFLDTLFRTPQGDAS